MKIGIIVAMGKELALLEPLIENRRQVALNGFTFTLGEIGSREVVAMPVSYTHLTLPTIGG